jgi:CheY-like chemotaxis protein
MSRRIALIDDDGVFLAMLHALLGEEGYEPHAFLDGIAADARIRACAPHAIVLDIPRERPDAGWALLDRVRRDPALRATPVIVCVAAGEAREEHTRALRGGGYTVTVLPKPFDLDDLLTLLDQVLSQASAMSG